MNKATLPTLGIEFTLGENDVFHDDGIINASWSEFVQYTAALYGGQGMEFTEDKICITKENPGYFLAFKNCSDGKNHFYVGAQDLKNSAKNIAVKAHEETHMLTQFDKFYLLEDKIFREQGKRFIEPKMINSEIKAHIGAIYALIKNGHNPYKTIKALCPDFNDAMVSALEYYGILDDKKIMKNDEKHNGKK